MARVLLMVAFVGALVLWQVEHRAVVESELRQASRDAVRAPGAETADRAR